MAEQQPDEFHGVGGSYRVNKQGKRELVERTQVPDGSVSKPAPFEPGASSDAGTDSKGDE